MDSPDDDTEIMNESLDETEEVPSSVIDAQFDSPKSNNKAKRVQENYKMEDLFWQIEVIDNWEEKIKELKTPE